MLTVVARPFVDFFEDDFMATELEFFSDASLNFEYGIGGRFEQDWSFTQWPTNFIRDNKPSIQYVELLGLAIAVFIWSKKLANRRVTVFCDNSSVLSMVNHTSTGGMNCMILIWKLVLRSLQFNFRIFAKHVKSEHNQVADSLSRLDFCRFKALARKLNLKPLPEKLPEELWPVDKIWVKEKE